MPPLLHFTLCVLAVSYCSYQVSGENKSCQSQCGKVLQNCSCHASCLNLGNCCTDYGKLCLQILPHSGSLMGGKDFTVLDVTFDKSANLTCRFNNETDTQGYISDSGQAHCISPLVLQTGQIPFTLLFNGSSSSSPSGTWLAVHHSKVSEHEKSTLVDAKKWQYYGTPGHNGSLTMTWNSTTLSTHHVRVEVWGYNETGIPYEESWEAHWTYLYTLDLSYPNTGNFTFIPVPAQSPFDQWEVGMLRVSASNQKEGERNIHAIWSPVHALAWHLSNSFRDDPAGWASNKCMAWVDLEKNTLPDFLNETADCPCTLQQSRADTGRYHTDYGCNIEKGSVCTYHPGAVHCVRSIQASPQFAAGQQCCYDASGVQVLTTDSLGGSTPDRGHDWGSSPYKKPPRIPGFSHWLYDVITFYYCCLWSDNCHYYLELRPSSDCQTYQPPKVASAFGEPHIITFDGLNYTYKGKGEYYLVNSTDPSLTIQCRTTPFLEEHSQILRSEETRPAQPSASVIAVFHDDRARRRRSVSDKINVASISSVAMQEEDSDVVEVRLKNGTQEELETLLNGEVLSFKEQSWMDMKGVFLFSPIPSNVTAMFPSGAGVEVRAIKAFLSISVLLPELFLNKTQGLLGVMNGDREDDLTLRNGTQLASSASPEEIFNFGADWAVTEQTSLFQYDSQELINSYKLKHDPDFVPTFKADENKNETLTKEAKSLCGDDIFCIFDVLTTNSLEIGNATKISYSSHRALVDSLQPVITCGWLAPPANGSKNGASYLAGSVITFSCNKGFLLSGSKQRTCQDNGTWSGEPTICTLASPNSCASQCGQVLAECSCHATCEKLGICCPDYSYFCVRISPDSGLLMGGRDFVIVNVTFNTGSVVKCRFNNEIIVDGFVDLIGHAHCVSPLLYETGRIPFELSVDGGNTYSHSGTWLSVHPGKVSESEKCTLVNETKWQYYGTPNYEGSLTVEWNPNTLKSDLVNIEVWGYTESGEPYTASWSPSWKYLYTLVQKHINDGTFTFKPQPAAAEYTVFEFGSLRIVSSEYNDGKWNIQSLWSVDHAMAWHLGEDFRKDSAGWAHDKCLKWHESDMRLPDFLSEIIDCPCTLAQSRADTGRFHPDYGCDIDSGSVCTYHPGAVHCVRGIYGSPKYAAGQQCCYDERGIQVLTSDSVGGSTPDRGHDWGSPPYRKPPRVPGFSHWLYDVISFYYCCLWSDNCQYYLELRPSSDCRTYRPPRVASSFGDPHFITFDGVEYTFKGKGEYTLVNTSYKSLVIQGRTQPAVHVNGSTTSVTGFSSVAMQEGSSDILEVRLAEDLVMLEVLLNQEPLNFNRTWLDLKGVFLFYGANKRVTAMFPSGAGVEVRGRGKFLSINVLLPEEFMNQTQGLMGVMNNNPNDDFTLRDGRVLPTDSTSEQLFQFGADWAVTNDSSLFTYDSRWLIENYKEKHDPNFLPTFSVQEDPNDPLTEYIKRICGNDYFCRFDILTTRDLEVGNATLWSHENHKNLVQSLQPVISCGWLEPPKNGKKEGTSYLNNSEVIFTCNKGYLLVGSSSRKCQADGTWSGETSQCVSDNTLGIVLGCVFGFLTLLVLLILIALHEKKHSKKKELNAPTVTFHQSKDP
ncbi:sushi domain-containing protein 2 [Hyla sarda]|uniref:sushi domain-containing protein 2 n=1 Tax=Hyla sarda TaxID=327740 RepID=UPI0024C3DF10|nr:sushi domain-containing protein 2 [Hyla sarda]